MRRSGTLSTRSPSTTVEAEFRSRKNTLTRIAAENQDRGRETSTSEGPAAIMFAYGDIVIGEPLATSFQFIPHPAGPRRHEQRGL